MNEKKYCVIDVIGNVIAKGMDLETALLLIKAYCNEYYMDDLRLTLQEEPKCKGNTK